MAEAEGSQISPTFYSGSVAYDDKWVGAAFLVAGSEQIHVQKYVGDGRTLKECGYPEQVRWAAVGADAASQKWRRLASRVHQVMEGVADLAEALDEAWRSQGPNQGMGGQTALPGFRTSVTPPSRSIPAAIGGPDPIQTPP